MSDVDKTTVLGQVTVQLQEFTGDDGERRQRAVTVAAMGDGSDMAPDMVCDLLGRAVVSFPAYAQGYIQRRQEEQPRIVPARTMPRFPNGGN